MAGEPQRLPSGLVWRHWWRRKVSVLFLIWVMRSSAFSVASSMDEAPVLFLRKIFEIRKIVGYLSAFGSAG